MGTLKLTQSQVNEKRQRIKELSEELEDFKKTLTVYDDRLARTYSGPNSEEYIVELEKTLLSEEQLLKINELFKHINIL